MPNITNFEYYTNNGTAPTNGNWGSYQHVPFADIVNNFMLIYVGNDKLLNNVKRHEVIFHAKQAIKELNYDALKTPKILELTLSNTNQMVLPPDYVNFIRISLEVNGTLLWLAENKQTNYSNTYLQDNDADIVFDIDGNVIETMSQLDMERLAGNTQQMYMGSGQYNGYYGWCCDGDWYFPRYFGGQFGMDPETANVNGTYKIDKANGVINFSSDFSGRNVVLEYISDGMENGDDSAIVVDKLAERAVYAYTKWAIMNEKFGMPMYERNEAKKQRKAEIDNAKLRMTGNLGNLIMVLRGQGKWIK
jgi:hypothetical protein